MSLLFAKEVSIDYEEDCRTHIEEKKRTTATLRELGKLFRSVGQNPTEETIQQMIHTFDEKKGEGEFTFPDFLKICESSYFEDPIKEEKLLECFREFDKEATGKISILQLRYILQQLGEKLSDEEADAFIEWAQKVRKHFAALQGHKRFWVLPYFAYTASVVTNAVLSAPDVQAEDGVLQYEQLVKELMDKDPNILS
ncbi:UNVERIFIED_CONTAM: hypothetical protein H355_003857 [Colinus virginianus]|nr:hypothetical protein H355_003857 [Colinus virginianus]